MTHESWVGVGARVRLGVDRRRRMELMGGPDCPRLWKRGRGAGPRVGLSRLGRETCQRDCWSNREESPDWDRKIKDTER
jgi:hypothetical protein